MRQKQEQNNHISRREEIIKAAARIFAAKGYHGTTLDEIAREIGVSKPALYYHIKNKEEILKEIVGRIMEPMETVARVGRSGIPPRQRIAQMIRMLVQFAAERQEITLIALELNKILPTRSREALKKRRKDVEEVLIETLDEGIKKGDFKTGNSKMYAFAILAAANSVYRWYDPHGNLTHGQIAEQFIRLLELGYLK
ncbi:MAG TPA: TetR/AcrR family transcriptional regulator [Dehalococcoidia bacterium]|nr:TetR/AcrR family transcriptional regulator [Dehalococcoidia bacterium]